jgi:hypothetical protein
MEEDDVVPPDWNLANWSTTPTEEGGSSPQDELKFVSKPGGATLQALARRSGSIVNLVIARSFATAERLTSKRSTT